MSVLTLIVEFRGRGTPMENSPGFTLSEAIGPVFSVSGARSDPQVPSTVRGEARMRTLVYANGQRFWEAGEIRFARLEGSLIVDSPEPGRVHQLPDGSSCGAIAWRVVSGTGRLAGAQGIVTGNFTGDATGAFHDYQLYNLVLPG